MALFVNNQIHVDAPVAKVWDYLVNPAQTKKYMFGCEALSDWKPGSPLIWKGNFNGVELVAVKGNVVEIIPEQKLVYTTFDPNNPAMEDLPENYLTVTYRLEAKDGGTEFFVQQGDYSTVADGEARYKEASNNGEGWMPLLVEIKKLVEAES